MTAIALFAEPFFWVPVLIAFLFVEAAFLSAEKTFSASVTFGVTLLLLQIFTTFKPFTLIFDDPALAVVMLGMYFVLGAAFSIIKWYSFVHTIMRRLSEKTDELYKHKASYYTGLSESDKVAYLTSLRHEAKNRLQGYNGEFPIRVAKNKSLVTTWIVFWPIVALVTFFDDPMRRIGRFIARKITGVLQSISDNAYEKYNKKYTL